MYTLLYGEIVVLLQKILSLNFMNMKKTLFSIAMCLVGISVVYALSFSGTPILFVDIYAVMPCDDGQNGDMGGRPDPNRVIGGIDGNDLNIGIVGGEDRDAGEVIVIDPETGEIIIEEVVIGQTSINIPEPGSYTAYVTVGGTTYAGEFEVE